MDKYTFTKILDSFLPVFLPIGGKGFRDIALTMRRDSIGERDRAFHRKLGAGTD